MEAEAPSHRRVARVTPPWYSHGSKLPLPLRGDAALLLSLLPARGLLATYLCLCHLNHFLRLGERRPTLRPGGAFLLTVLGLPTWWVATSTMGVIDRGSWPDL